MHTTESIAHPAREELELGAVLHALSDPVRLRIVAKLAHSEGDHTCGSFALPVTKSTCTHHFKVLREAGVIQQRPQGTTRLNRLRRDDLEARFPGLLGCVLKAAEHADLLHDGGEDALGSVVLGSGVSDAPTSSAVA
jgi:DNA-binding transcriptional ArsR family regulator